MDWNLFVDPFRWFWLTILGFSSFVLLVGLINWAHKEYQEWKNDRRQ